MSKILIFHSSQTGNTEKMAKAVAEGAKSNGNEVELANTRNFLASPEELGKFDAILVGTPTYHHDMPNDIKELLQGAAVKAVNLKGKIGAAFGSYGWTGEAPKLVIEILKFKFEMKIIEPPLLSNFAPDQNMLDLCKAFGKRVSESASAKSSSIFEEPSLKSEQPKQEAKENSKYSCKICGYVYYPALGDPNSKIPAGTPFEKLPENWVCPICGAAKDQFEKTS